MTQSNARAPLDVLFVASECAPLVKTGGLADVVGALPLALGDQGCRVRVLLPAYPGLADRLDSAREVLSIPALFGAPARVLAGQVGALDCLLLEAPHLYDRPGGIYLGPDGADWPDNDLRYAALSVIGARIGREGLKDGWCPALVHAHDWQAGLVPVYLGDGPECPATVLSVHNIAFQGLFPAAVVPTLGLPASGMTPAGFEYWGQLSFLKAGLVHSDALSTVSETYARELTEPAFGLGLEGVIAERAGVLRGIVNGIDLDIWNPETDPEIIPFSRNRLGARARNRVQLATELGLDAGDGVLFGVVSRLTAQKGLDLLLDALPGLLAGGAQLAVLGSGDAALEAAFAEAAARHPGQVTAVIGYDEGLAHRIYAGADTVVVPSRFEPCGLTQLYAQRYGALPLVARTGGLADTVIDASPAALGAGVATGVQVAPGSAAALGAGIARICALKRDRALWQRMQKNAMALPLGWARSAAAYRALYDETLARRR